MNDWTHELKNSFKDKEYRQIYAEGFVNTYIAAQIKILREQRGWTQTELAKRAGMKQPRISVMEDVNYESWSIDTLKRLASAFDLTLCVSFESFRTRYSHITRFGRTALERSSFEDDPFFKEEGETISSAGSQHGEGMTADITWTASGSRFTAIPGTPNQEDNTEKEIIITPERSGAEPNTLNPEQTIRNVAA